MGVGVGNKVEPVQSRDPPVHGRVGGKAGFQGVNVRGQVLKTFLDGVKAGKGAEQREMRRPDMSGDEHRFGAGVQGDFQQIPAVQTQNGTAVGVDVADEMCIRDRS